MPLNGVYNRRVTGGGSLQLRLTSVDHHSWHTRTVTRLSRPPTQDAGKIDSWPVIFPRLCSGISVINVRLATTYCDPTLHPLFTPAPSRTMTMTQEQPSSPVIEDFNVLVRDLHNAIDIIASQVVSTIEARNPSLVSDKPSTPASSELLSAFRAFTKLSDEFSSYATSPSEHLTMIAGAFYESTALNVVSELGIADLIGNEKVPVGQLAKKVNVDEGRLRESAVY